MTELTIAKPRPQKWRDLPPVDRSVSIDDRRVSVTFMRRHDVCDRAAYLELLHEGGVGSHEMNRGTVFHTFAAMAINHLIESDEAKLTPRRRRISCETRSSLIASSSSRPTSDRRSA